VPDGGHAALRGALPTLRCRDKKGATMNDIINVDYDGLIPNNVGLGGDARVKRALEKWHPGYIDWWHDMGPDGFQQSLVYLRTAVSVDPKGWAKFDYVKMPDYKWGILLAPQVEGRKVPFGAHKGEDAWQDVPGEHRAMLRRLIVIQGDTEPASVEQQRYLGKTAPSLYDMRNLFQVNVEEGRHLWAMVYLLQKYFGADGREEAEALLQRRSGDADTPRMLGAFNEETPDWLSFFMFTFFTDRDGKMQLEALAQSGFDPLSRTCRFMLTEEAHHMFVGETGVGRVIERTCEAMTAAGISDPRDKEAARTLGVIDLPTLQKKANLHFSLTLDLFGNEISTNAANAFHAGIKGRFREDKLDDDHQLESGAYPVLRLVEGKIAKQDVPALSALNMRLRDDFVADCNAGVGRWNRNFEKYGIPFQLKLPHVAFHRHIGEFSGIKADADGNILSDAEWERRKDEFLPSAEDRAYIESLMKPEVAPGKFASWIAPPKVGIDNKPGDFEYVKIV
jgi:benzoyl-CoA 2,3-epoxidase subunit B